MPIRPGREALRISQDRIIEKDFLSDLGLKTAPYQLVEDLSSLQTASKNIGLPAILKTTRLGYDGKGQHPINSIEEINSINIDFSSGYILEKLVVGSRVPGEITAAAFRLEDDAPESKPSCSITNALASALSGAFTRPSDNAKTLLCRERRQRS